MKNPTKLIGVLPVALACALIGAGIRALAFLTHYTIWELPVFLLVLLIPGAILAIPFGIAMVLFKTTRRPGVRIVVGCLATTIAFFSTWPFLSERDCPEVASVRGASQPLFEPLAQYEKRHGRPPETLSLLIPDQLPVLPRIVADPRFLYTTRVPTGRWEISYRLRSLFDDEVMVYRPGGDYDDILRDAEARRVKDWVSSPYYSPAIRPSPSR